MLVEHNWKNTIAFTLLFFVLAMVFVSYIPIIYLTSLYDYFSLGIMGLMVLLVLVTFFRSHFLNNRFLLLFSLIMTLIIIEFIVFFVGHLRFTLDDARQIIIVFLCMIVGYTTIMTESQLKKISLFYIIGALLIGLYAIVFYTGSFSFGGDRNLIAGKNQIGGMVAVGGALSLYFFMTNKDKQTLFFALALFSFFVSAVLRCRSAFVAFIFFTIVMCFKKYPIHIVSFFVIVLLLFYLLFKSSFDSFFVDALIGRGDLEDIDVGDLTTGRAARNEKGIQYLFGHFWVGELFQSANIPWIHNYLLLRLVKYGVWSMFFIVLYFLVIGKMVKEYFRDKHLVMDKMGFFIPIIPFFVSLLEPSYPFGPGTVQVFVYVLFGYALQKQHYRIQ